MRFSAYDPETQRALRLFVVLMRCADSVSEHARVHMRRHQFKTSEFAVLELLYHTGPTPLSLIAEKVLLTKASMTYVIDQLEKQGLVQRVNSPKDRRVSYAELTQIGQEKIATAFPDHAQHIQRAVSCLSLEEQEQAIALLKKLGLAAKRTLMHDET